MGKGEQQTEAEQILYGKLEPRKPTKSTVSDTELIFPDGVRPGIPPKLIEALTALIDSTGFHPSTISKRCGISQSQATQLLDKLEVEGVVSPVYKVLCPESDRTIKSFKNYADIPLDDYIICELCEASSHFITAAYDVRKWYTVNSVR